MRHRHQYIERNFDRYLADWKQDPRHKPLLVRGAREVGKTESIRRFGRHNYRTFVEINFADFPEYKTIVQDGCSAPAVVSRIACMNPSKKLIPGKTLLYFDEIQDFPEIGNSLDSFREDGRFDVISSGCLFGIPNGQLSSIPPGAKTDYTLKPLDFGEFMAAKGYGKNFVEDILAHMVEHRPLPIQKFLLLSALFMDYGFTGGMPRVVLSDFEHHSQAGNLELLRRINSYIVEDVQQYVKKSERERVLRVLVQLQFQIAGKNKKLQISKVAHDARLKGFSSIIKCLCDAGIVIPCRALDHPALPLEENYAEKRFKLYMADLVLLIAMFDNNDLTYFGSKEFTRELTRGMIENQVGAELSKAGAELFYYKRPNSPLQIPFFLQSSKYLVPIEISGQGRSKALRTLIEDKRYPDFWGIKLGRENIGFKDSLLTLPLSTAFLLPRLLALGGPI